MKKPIRWHEECLSNSRHYLDALEREIDAAIARRDRLRADLLFYEAQIAEAKHRGMEAFDNERLLKTKPRA